MIVERMELDEVISAGFWALAAGFALRAAQRGPRPVRGVWILIGACCAVFVGDKVFDFQALLYEAGRTLLHEAFPRELRAGYAGPLRYAVLLPLVGFAVGAILWLGRRRARLGPPEALGLLGVCGIAAYVGLRLLPPVGDAFEGFRGWSVEAPCGFVLLVGAVRAARPDRGRMGAGEAHR
jgi:hypothetical protein